MRQVGAQAILKWRYEPPLDFYNAKPESLASLLDPRNCYFAAFSGEEVVGFCCFGPDARVEGGYYSDTALDVGAGLRPDLTGCGNGRSFVAAIVSFADQYTLGRPLRATVAGFNTRAIRTVESVGFAEVGRFQRPTDSMEFVMLQRNGAMAYKER